MAKQGVAESDAIGLQVWKSAVIEKIQHSDNIGLIASKIGIGSPQFVTQRIRSLGTDAMALDNFSAYAFAKIVSDFDQTNVTMRVGSDDAIKVWFNGEFINWTNAKVHVLNHGLHYASCVFEGERVYDGEIFKLEEHTDRLFYSAKRMGIVLSLIHI